MMYKYDGRGDKCPVPLINLRLLMKKMAIGDECTLILNDAGSVKDIPKFLNKKGVYYHKKNLGNDIIELNVKL